MNDEDEDKDKGFLFKENIKDVCIAEVKNHRFHTILFSRENLRNLVVIKTNRRYRNV